MTSIDEGGHKTPDYEDSRNVMWLLGQVLMIPISAMVHSIEMLLRTWQGMQHVTNQSMEVMVGPNAVSSRTPESGCAPERQAGSLQGSNAEDFKEINKEDNKLIDNNQNLCKPDQRGGKCLILWRYKVLFTKRDLEFAFPEAEDLVPDDTADITAWKIAEFIQQLGRNKVEVPSRWIEKQYPPPKAAEKGTEKGPGKAGDEGKDKIIYRFEDWHIEGSDSSKGPTYEEVLKAPDNGKRVFLVGLPENDKKYLRLFAQQLASYSRQEPEYQERQIEVLREIRDRIR